jgi:hypothetical protein
MLRSARGRGVTPGFLLALVALLVAGCANGFPGDPAAPVAFDVNATHSLSAVKVLLCPGERVLSIAVTRNVTTNAVFKAGPVLWQIDAIGASTVATFEPGKPIAGFRVVVAPSLPITGRIGVDFRTTLTTTGAGTDTLAVPAGSTTLAGQVLDAQTERRVIKDRCR